MPVLLIIRGIGAGNLRLSLESRLEGIHLSEGLAALIAENSDDGIRYSAAIQPTSTLMTGSFFQNRCGRFLIAPVERQAPAAFVFI